MTIIIIIIVFAGIVYWLSNLSKSKATSTTVTDLSAKSPRSSKPKQELKQQQKNKSEDPYLRCACVINPSTTKEYIPFVDTIKRKSEWEALGFKIRIDRHGNCKTARKYISFNQVTRFKDIELEAIKTGKKITTYPLDVLLLLNHGCSYADFVDVTEDIKYYCSAHGLFKNGQFEPALTEINKAITLKPKESLYRDLSIEIRFSKNDISAIEDDITYQIETYGDLSSMVHGGRAERWLKLLYKLDETKKASDFETTFNHLIDEAIAKKSVYKKPEGIKYVVNGSDEAGEQLAITVHNNEVAFIKAKKEQFNNCIMKLKERQIKKATKAENNKTTHNKRVHTDAE